MRARFARKGPLALSAEAFGQEYELIPPAEPAINGGVAVVMIMGPLTHHGEWWFGDTYDAIEARVGKALATAAKTVVLKIDSPGGEVNGCLECARTIRRMAASAGKRLIAYVDEFAASAAYALACAAPEIYLPESAYVGSIGVIDMLLDLTANDAKEGYKWGVITSGARKADGNMHVQMSDEVKNIAQGRVDSLAGLFFDLVAEFRGVDALMVKGMEAAVYRGQDAVRVKLANGVIRWDELLAMVAGGKGSPKGADTTAAPAAVSGSTEDAMTRAELIQALKAAMAEDAPAPAPEKTDEEQMSKEELVAALKSMLAEDDPPADKPKEPPAAPAAQEHEEPDGDEAAKAKALARVAGAQAARPTPADAGLPPGHHYLPNASASNPATTAITELEARVRAMELEKLVAAEAQERANLVAGAQMSDATRKWLSDPKTPIGDVRAACKALPPAMQANPAAAAMANPTPASREASRPALDPAVSRQLSAMMGMPAAEPGDIRWGGQSKDPSDTTTQFDRVFPTAMSREKAREVLKANEERLRASGSALGNAMGGGQ